MQEPSRWSGALLFAAPILIQIPYSLLILNFEYPAILHQSPSVILERFATAGPTLPLIWLSFALAILPLLLGIALLPSAFPDNRWLSTLTPIGIASALLQMLGLARWVFLVPFLAAQHHTNPQTDTITIAFELQHRLFGNLMGEHLGQLFLGVWTTTAALAFTGNWHRLLGLAAALLFTVGSFSNLAPILDPIPGIAFLVWSVWSCIAGFKLLKARAETPLASSPSTSENSGETRLLQRNQVETKHPQSNASAPSDSSMPVRASDHPAPCENSYPPPAVLSVTLDYSYGASSPLSQDPANPRAILWQSPASLAPPVSPAIPPSAVPASVLQTPQASRHWHATGANPSLRWQKRSDSPLPQSGAFSQRSVQTLGSLTAADRSKPHPASPAAGQSIPARSLVLHSAKTQPHDANASENSPANPQPEAPVQLAFAPAATPPQSHRSSDSNTAPASQSQPPTSRNSASQSQASLATQDAPPPPDATQDPHPPSTQSPLPIPAQQETHPPFHPADATQPDPVRQPGTSDQDQTLGLPYKTERCV